MNHVQVTFLGKGYDLACDEGQEEHLHVLARELAERLNDFERRFVQPSQPKPAETMLWIMTALTLLDENHDLRREVSYWQQEANADTSPSQESQRRRETEQAMAETLQHIAQRLERMAEEENH